MYFFPQGHAHAIPANEMRSVVVRDNLAMVTAVPTSQPPFSSAKWIINDPTQGPAWTVNNGEEPYTPTADAFVDRPLFGYRRRGGPVSARSGRLTTARFTFPHGSVVRDDSDGGLG